MPCEEKGQFRGNAMTGHTFLSPTVSRQTDLYIKIHICICRGPAPVDPGNSKGGRRWRGKTCLLIDIRLD